MSWSGTVTIHQGAQHYTENPHITISLNVGDITRSGNTISCTAKASINGLSGESYFGYGIQVFAQLDSGSRKTLFTKPNSPSQWSSGAYSGSATCTSTNTGTSATFKILARFNCTCADAAGGANGGDINNITPVVVWSRSLSAPAANVTITFNLDGGTRTGGGALTQSVAIGGTATAPTCTRTQCNFVGWDKPLTNIQSSQTITAIWDYIIKYDTSELYYIKLPDQIKHKNKNLTLDNTNLSSENPGHEHTGWATSKGGAPVYTLGGTYTQNAPDTLYPAWDVSKTTFTVIFDLKGGTSSGGGALRQTVRYGQSATPPSNPTKSGRRFMGWLGNYKNVTSDRTIYAMWDSSPLWIFTGTKWIPFAN